MAQCCSNKHDQEMPVATEKVVELRSLLREQFPEAHAPEKPAIPESEDGEPGFSLGVKCLDDLRAIEPGTVTELVGRRAGCGVGAVIAALVKAASDGEPKRHLALIDGAGSFDPQGLGEELCRRLLWVRCRRDRIDHAVKAADLLLRDGNLPLVLMDLQLGSPRDIRPVPGSSWYRLRNLAEKTGATFLAFTPEPLIPAAQLRIELRQTWDLDDIDRLPGKGSLAEADVEMAITRQQRMHASSPVERSTRPEFAIAS